MVGEIVLSSSLPSSTKTIIYPNLTTNSLILKRERKGGRISMFLRKKGRAKNLPIGKARGRSWRRRWSAFLDYLSRAMARV
jgi:hypothetical protein